jgi:hypothetical protein
MKTIIKKRIERKIKLTRTVSLVLSLLALALSLNISAQISNLPKAETLFATFVEKTGGEKAYDQIQNRVTVSKMVMANPPLSGIVTSTIAKAGKYYISIDSTAIGKLENGSNGKIIWDINPVLGPKIREGHDRSRLLCVSSLNLPAQWKTAFKRIDCTGIDTIEGKQAYKVEVTNMENYSFSYYFDKESGLIVKIELPIESLAGQSIQEIFLGNYKMVDGIQFPYTQKRIEQGREMKLTYIIVKHNVDIPEKTFMLPDRIQKIINPSN